ncbi:MAG: amino acid permease [Acidobacteriia bacterium]|nr:amino acid permease [Terriglobia bacterium]
MNSADRSSTTVPGERPQLLRALGLWQTTAIAMGVMIGTGIFLVPSDVTRQVGSPKVALAVWVGGGLLSLFGALSFAELAGMMPQAGGQYIYLRETYGSLVSFLCGWSFFLAAQSGGISVLAVGFAKYLGQFLPLTTWELRAAAALSIAFFTLINYVGVKEGGRVQSLLTGVKVGALVAFILLGYLWVHGPAARAATSSAHSGSGFLASFGVAMVGVLWAYDGWNTCTFAAGEVKNPQRDVPLALILGTLAVMVLYAGLNLVYYRVLAVPEVAASSLVGADAAVRIMGRTGSQVMALLIIISTLGSLNGSILAAPRVYYAMAKDGLFFRWCADVHPRFRTPHRALLIQGFWAILLVVMGTYEQLFTYTIFAAWVFYALTGLAVIVLRRTQPNLPRPYRVFGYPWVPVAFVLASTCFLVNMLVAKPAESGLGAVIVALGVPMYFGWKSRAEKCAVRKGSC